MHPPFSGWRQKSPIQLFLKNRLSLFLFSFFFIFTRTNEITRSERGKKTCLSIRFLRRRDCVSILRGEPRDLSARITAPTIPRRKIGILPSFEAHAKILLVGNGLCLSVVNRNGTHELQPEIRFGIRKPKGTPTTKTNPHTDRFRWNFHFRVVGFCSTNRFYLFATYGTVFYRIGIRDTRKEPKPNQPWIWCTKN